jgi:hypothetical protein
MELCYARSQSMRIHRSRKKIPELVSSVWTKAGPIEVTDPARRERDLLAKIIQLGRHFLSTDALVQLVSSKTSVAGQRGSRNTLQQRAIGKRQQARPLGFRIDPPRKNHPRILPPSPGPPLATHFALTMRAPFRPSRMRPPCRGLLGLRRHRITASCTISAGRGTRPSWRAATVFTAET